MKTNWAKWIRLGLLLLAGIGAGGLVGCADEYAAYPAYGGGYYASYRAAPYPYYGPYGYRYRAYGPYYGGPYYGGPYYGGNTVVVSGSRGYAYRDSYARWHNRRDRTHTQSTTRSGRTTTRNVRTRSTTVPRYQNDDEKRYYTPR
jgi:hypothetical protein